MKTRFKLFLCCFLCISTLVMLSANIIAYAKENDANVDTDYYTFNQGKLYDNAFSKLPQGAIQPEDWLLQQLLYQKENLTGLLHDNWAIYGPSNQWRGGSSTSMDAYWEKGPYYLRGLVALAWTLDDPELKAMAMEWLDPILESGTEEGYFGPSIYAGGGATLDWWPHMIVIGTLRDYYESTVYEGDPDERVIEVLGNYFEFQFEYIPKIPMKTWSIARGGENIEVILWYYNHVYDPSAPEKSDWLLGLAEMIAENTGSKDCGRSWTDVYINTTTREHTVDSTQALSTPAVIWQMTGNEEDRIALREAIRNWGIDHGRIDGLVHSDEVPRENYPHRGVETCAVVEALLSYETTMSITGEAWIGDQIENVAYNTLPACYTSDFSAHVYFQAENRVMAVHGDHDQSDDRGSEAAYSVYSGYECCFPNMHMGWPKFVSSMYMATSDGGLAVIAYGPNRVEAKVSNGKTAIFHQQTDYPFKDTVGITYEGETATFPLLLRVPSWCSSPSFKLNGENITGDIVDGYVRLEREWSEGDVVEIKFPREIRISYWCNNSVGVQYGALNFCLGVEEDWRSVTDTSGMGTPTTIPVNNIYNYEIFAASDWNYALVLDTDDIASSFEIEIADDIPLQPFTLDNSPIKIKATGQTVPSWELRSNTVPEPPYSPLPEDTSLQEEIVLVPYGSAKLRITLMPWVGEEVPSDLSTSRDRKEALAYTEDGKSVLEFDNVIVRDADDYTLYISYEGSGDVTININSKFEQKLTLGGNGTHTIDGLISRLPTCIDSYTKKAVKGFTFDAGQNNNIRFFNENGVKITGIKVVPVNPFDTPKITAAEVASYTVKLSTNLARDSASYYFIEYGKASGNYTTTVKNVLNDKAVVSGLESGNTYYFRVGALINGVMKYSNEISATIGFAPSLDTQQNINFTDTFDSANSLSENWNIYGDTHLVTHSNGKAVIASSRNIKMFTGNTSWTDYAIEATLSGGNSGSNFGVVFRASAPSGAHGDNYNGYYIGIIPTKSNLTLKIGYCDQAWHEAESSEVEVKGKTYTPGQNYTIKVLVCGNTFKVYVDGVFAYEGTNSKFKTGNVGVRTYITPFELDSFTVRNLTEAEEDLFDDSSSQAPAEFELKNVRPIYKGVQVATGFESPNHTYKLIYGTSSGNYTGEILNLWGLNRPTYPKLTTDKFALQLCENNKTYYIRLVALSGNEIASISKEYKITTGGGCDTSSSKQAAAMTEALAAAKATSTDGYTDASVERLEWAIGYAESLNDPTLSELSLARSSLALAINNLEIGSADKPSDDKPNESSDSDSAAPPEGESVDLSSDTDNEEPNGCAGGCSGSITPLAASAILSSSIAAAVASKKKKDT